MATQASGRDPVEQLAEEFAERYRRGERPSLTEYTDKYPELADQIRDLFPTLVEMEQFGSLEGPPTGPHVPTFPSDGTLPRQLGEYRILREVGRGGMGVVYEAVQESLGRHVALKVLTLQSLVGPDYLERFQREARAAAHLHHTNVVPVFGVGESEGVHYYAMQFIRGQNLSTVLKELKSLWQEAGGSPAGRDPGTNRDLATTVAQGLWTGRFPLPGAAPAETQPPSAAAAAEGPPPPSPGSGWGLPEHPKLGYFRSVARVGVQVAEALEYAHRQGILHRDIKPSNLLLDTQGTVWVTDFGLAKVEGTDDLTSPGDIVGTFRYMAPERFQGRADPRSDVYGLGITLYEMLVLRPAFTDSDRVRLMERIAHDEPPRPRQLNRRIPRDLETIVWKAMAKEPGDRYPTAEALAQDLRRLLADQPIHARHVSGLERAWRWCRRSPLLAGLMAAVALSLLAGAGVSASFAARASDQAATAERQWQRAEAKAEEVRRERDQAQRYLYGARMNLAQIAWEHTHVANVLDLLEPYHRPPPGRPDLRGWEWHYQWRLCHQELRTLRAHTGAVSEVAFSPNGKWLATGGADGIVRVWDVADGRELGTLRGHQSPVRAVAFSPEGGVLASGSTDGALKVWDVTRWEERRTLSGGAVMGIAFSPEGKRLASGGQDGTVRLWDAATGQELHTLKGHARAVWGVAFSQDGKFLASGGEDGTVRLWDAAGGREVRALRGHKERILRVAFGPDGRLASGGEYGTITLWNTDTGHSLGNLGAHKGAVLGLAFSPDGRWLASGSRDQTVKVWNTYGSWGRGQTLEDQSVAVRSVAFSPDGRWLASGRADGTVKLWDAARYQEFGLLRWHTDAVVSVAFSPDRSRAAVGTWVGGGAIHVREAVGGKEHRTLKDLSGGRKSVAFSPEGERLAVGGKDGTVRLWDVAGGKELGALRGHPSAVLSVAFSPEGKRLASGGQDATVKVWDLAGNKALGTLLGHTGPVLSVAFSPEGKRLASGGQDGTVRLWDAATGQELHTLKGHARAVWGVAFSQDGKFLASGGEDGTVRLWDAAGGQELHTLKGHTDGVASIAFSPDGARLASGSGDKTVKVWDVTSGQELRTLKGHINPLLSVAFSPDGMRLVSSSISGTVEVWDARPPTPEVRVEREALGLVEYLFAKPLPRGDVLARLQTDPTLSKPVRQKALGLAEQFREQQQPGVFNTASFDAVRQPYLNRLEYQLALRQAEVACGMSPENGSFLETLGIAQYRLGQYREALVTLTRADALNQGSPLGTAFRAMSLHRLGQQEKARAVLAGLRETMKNPRGAQSAGARAFLREAEALITALPPDRER